ncbi:hypothetical protein SDC9_61668 [bioreactor metagenome]|uniref:Uncharacterized protein n=1 Tax=bioreactor metagenome TaxID=1076179 RepID=A0A644XGC9_9ZZZZ
MVIRDIYLLRRSEEFYLEPGHEASVNLALEKSPPFPCTKLCGQVISGCKSISGATVKILDKGFKPMYHTDTDSEGNFSFVNTLMPGEYEIIAAADGYTVSESRLISLMPSNPLYVTIKLVPDKNAGLGTVYGVVGDENNTPLPGVQVYVFEYGIMEFPKAVTITNSDGEYLVYGLSPGKYAIRAFLQGFLFPDDVEIEIRPKEMACADLYLYRGNSALEGTISGNVIHNGAGIPYAMTALYKVENNNCGLMQIQKANSRGFYLFSGLGPGSYIVKAKLEEEYKTLCSNVMIE